MGAAVSAVTGSVQGITAVPGQFASGDIQGGLEGVTGLSSLQGSQNALGQIGTISQADQTALQKQIANAQALSQTNQAQAVTQQGLANTAGASAQNLNTGPGGAVSASLGLLEQQAAGTAPSAAEAQLQAGKNQAIAAQQAIANSGNASQMISGQKTALDNAAQLTQQAANQATQLQATQQQVGQQNFANAANAQAGLGTQQQQIQQQAALGYGGLATGGQGQALQGQSGALGISQGALTATGQNQAQIAGGGMNAAGGILGAVLSDENTKTDIQPTDQKKKLAAVSSSFGDKPEDSWESRSTSSSTDKPDEPDPLPAKGYWANTGSQSASESISASFSDKRGKKDISKKDKVDAFLDAIDPVTFEYKKQDGKMGRTPGEHMGVIAQQVEKAPGGKSMIIETPEGKGIDLAAAVSTLMAAAAHTHDKVKQLEDLFESKKKK